MISVDSSSSIALTLETNNFGRIWNVSAMPGWLATKCLFPPVLIRDIDKYDNCTCQAVITQVAKVGSSHTAKVHVSCQSEVEGFSGQFYCKKCGITYLNEMLNKPGQMVRCSKYCLFVFGHFLSGFSLVFSATGMAPFQVTGKAIG